MNHLAHVYLAGPDADARLGGLLGDFWHGATDPAWRAGVSAGVILHRKIDVYTDSHPCVGELRALFVAPLRRYAGILLDMYFDHALARCWPDYSDQALSAISARTLDELAANASWLPAKLNQFAAFMRDHRLFEAYAEAEMIERVLAGIGQRLTRSNPLATAGQELWRRAPALDRGFATFFPQLVDFALTQRHALGLN